MSGVKDNLSCARSLRGGTVSGVKRNRNKATLLLSDSGSQSTIESVLVLTKLLCRKAHLTLKYIPSEAHRICCQRTESDKKTPIMMS